MLRFLIILALAVWIYAFIDCLNTPEKEVRKLPKVAWVIIILLFGQVLVGPIAWFVVGRPRKNRPYGATRPAERRWVAPDDNPDFLKSINDKKQASPEPPAAPAGKGDPRRSTDKGADEAANKATDKDARDAGEAGRGEDGDRGDRPGNGEVGRKEGGPEEPPPSAS